jgi:hypothetical protein
MARKTTKIPAHHRAASQRTETADAMALSAVSAGPPVAAPLLTLPAEAFSHDRSTV